MKRKRFVKLLMSKGFSRNLANFIAGRIPLTELTIFGKTERMTFFRTWNAVRAYKRLIELAQKEGNDGS